MENVLLPFILCIIIGATNFSLLHKFGKNVCIMCSPFKRNIISFAVGITLAYLFSDMIPMIFKNNGMNAPISILIGFVLFLVIEHIICTHVKKKIALKADAYAHSIFTIIFKIIQGILLYEFFKGGAMPAILFFIAMFIVDFAEDFSLHSLNAKVSKILTYISPLAPATGVVIGAYLNINRHSLLFLSSFTAGILLYIVASELVPKEKSKHQGYLIVGIFIYMIFHLII